MECIKAKHLFKMFPDCFIEIYVFMFRNMFTNITNVHLTWRKLFNILLLRNIKK